MTTSYNGWPASPDPKAIGIVPLTVARHSFPGGVKGGDVATVFRYFLVNYHLRVESLALGSSPDEWGYSYRQNRNANNLSCHASGTAVDVNATRHPNGARNTLSSAAVARLRVLQHEVGGVIKWGGDFSTTKDEMHHEIHGTAAQVHTVATRLKAVAWFKRELYRGCRGEDVKRLQRWLHVPDDGIFGTGTEAALKRNQAKLGVTQTGRLTKSLAFYVP
jgi:peptidoglycan hydrolase-like protein with peptidoglycan-binding domain